MKIVLSLFMSMLLAVFVSAAGAADTINLDSYNVTNMEIKKSIVKPLVIRGYTIDRITATNYKATYPGRGVTIEVTRTGSKIVIEGGSGIKPNWVVNLRKDISRWLSYYTNLKRIDN